MKMERMMEEVPVHVVLTTLPVKFVQPGFA